MKNIIIAFRSFLKKGRSNLVKVFSLGVGLAVSLVLISKIYFEHSYDNFYPHSDRLYQIQVNFSKDGGIYPSSFIPGAIAPGMKANVPEVEAATRFTYLINDNMVFFTPNRKRYSARFIMADNCFFDVLPRPVLAGNVKEVLTRPMYVMVSRKVAQMLGGGADVVGQSFVLDSHPGKSLTIGGVFEDLPENSHIAYDIIVSMPSIKNFMGDGSMNWVSNDRYHGYVKLIPGTSPGGLSSAFRSMQEKNMDMNELKRQGVDLVYFLEPLSTLNNTGAVKRTTVILGLLSFVLLFTAVMNYILIVITTLIGRTREIAVHKCYGASERNISGMVLSETFLHLILSVIIAVFLIFLFRETVQEMVSVSVEGLFTLPTLVVLAGVCVLVFLFTGLIPAHIFSRIPVASAFRNFQKTRRNWKRFLLFFQFIATAFLFSLLIIVGLQYNMMVNNNPGYSYHNMVYCNVMGVDNLLRRKVIDELRRLPYVASVATCSTIPVSGGASGNNLIDPETEIELFNYAEMYYVDQNYFPLMNIDIIDGENFEYGRSDNHSVLVSESFAEKLRTAKNWTGSVVGKSMFFTEHGLCTITGVYKDFRIGSIAWQDGRPSAHFYKAEPSDIVMVNLHRLQPEAIARVSAVLKNALPEKDVVIVPYEVEMVNAYRASRNFRNMVMIGGIISLIISLAGLIGYVNDEIVRRSKEIAVRKVNGATSGIIIRLLSREVVCIALPSAVMGVLCAWVMGADWLQQFAEKIPLSPFIFIGSVLVVLFIITSSVVLKAWKIANENPVKSIKAE